MVIGRDLYMSECTYNCTKKVIYANAQKELMPK